MHYFHPLFLIYPSPYSIGSALADWILLPVEGSSLFMLVPAITVVVVHEQRALFVPGLCPTHPISDFDYFVIWTHCRIRFLIQAFYKSTFFFLNITINSEEPIIIIASIFDSSDLPIVIFLRDSSDELFRLTLYFGCLLLWCLVSVFVEALEC